MEKSKIYDLLSYNLLHKWKDEIEKNDCGTLFFTSEQEKFRELAKELDEKSRELLKFYTVAVENKFECINYNIKIKTLNLGIKIGMELEKAFQENEE